MRIATAALLLLVLPLSAQRYDDTITVDVVDVPVYVERFGVPVEGLTRDDFELFVDGKPMPIDYFDVTTSDDVATRAPAGERAQTAPANLTRRRLVVLLFDAIATRHSLQRARRHATRLVDEAAAGDTFAVATLGPGGVLFVAPFTSDREVVRRAIATLRPSAARDPFRLAMLEDERGAEPDPQQAPAIAGGFSNDAIDLDAAQDDFSERSVVGALADLADRLANLDGLRQVLFFSEGRTVVPVAGPSTRAGLYGDMRHMHRRFREAGVILNVVGTGDPNAPGGAASQGMFVNTEMPQLLTSGFLWALAYDTGGIATTSLNDLRRRTRTAYVLGFRAHDGMDRQSIRVRVKNAPLFTDVRYRKTFAVDRPSNDDGLVLADTLLNDIPQNGVTLDFDVSPASFAASIPGVELLSYASRGSRMTLDVYFYVFDEAKRPVAWNRMQIIVDLEKGREFLSANPYTIRSGLQLAPGRYVAKALVHIEGIDRLGFRRAELVVPAS